MCGLGFRDPGRCPGLVSFALSGREPPIGANPFSSSDYNSANTLYPKTLPQFVKSEKRIIEGQRPNENCYKNLVNRRNKLED